MKAHKEIINSIDGVGGLGIGEGAPEIVTGSRDGKHFFFFLRHIFILALGNLLNSNSGIFTCLKIFILGKVANFIRKD